MAHEDFIIDLFCRVDDLMLVLPKSAQVALLPSELVTLGLLFAIKGVDERAIYRWIRQNHLVLFPSLPEHTWLFRSLKTHWNPPLRFLAGSSLLGIEDRCGIELIHSVPWSLSPKPFGGTGISNHRWNAGVKTCEVDYHLGDIIGWVWSPANDHDTRLRPMFNDRTVLFSDTDFHSTQGNSVNLKVCRRGERNDPMLIETVLTILTVICHPKKLRHRLAEYFQVHDGFMAVAFNLLINWFGLPANEDGFIPLSIAEFSL